MPGLGLSIPVSRTSGYQASNIHQALQLTVHLASLLWEALLSQEIIWTLDTVYCCFACSFLSENINNIFIVRILTITQGNLFKQCVYFLSREAKTLSREKKNLKCSLPGNSRRDIKFISDILWAKAQALVSTYCSSLVLQAKATTLNHMLI